jgi:hypothetical protein
MVALGNISHYVAALQKDLNITSEDRWLHTASFAFSSSVRQTLLPLSCGAAVVLATTDQIRDAHALFKLVRDHGVSILDVVPSYWRMCIQTLERMEPPARTTLLDNRLRLILSASESLLADIPKQWTRDFGHGACVVNMFGHTETTGIVALHQVRQEDHLAATVPIGRPIYNTRIYVLDSRQNPVPVGIPGEIYVGGGGVGRGYLHQPELTSERFLKDPFGPPESCMYRTGDLGRYRPDGTLEFLGRIDDQLKIRGCRIEPGEVEAVLSRHGAVAEACVVAIPSVAGQRLAACVAPRTNDGESRDPAGLISELQQFLKRNLPNYMTPSVIHVLRALPRVPNGKIDRGSLSLRFANDTTPLPHASNAGGKRAPLLQADVETANAIEGVLADIWKQVLKRDDIHIDANYFDLGGDSLLTTQVVSRAHKAGLELGILDLFRYQTIAELAQAVRNRRPSRDGVPMAGGRMQGEKEAPEVIHVTVESMRAFGREALEQAGLHPDGARIVTEVQIEASLRGQTTHNVGAIPRYARRIASARINPRPIFRIDRETPNSALIDADNGPGQWVGVFAMEMAVRKARDHGIGIVGARRSNHLGAAGHYAWLAATKSLIGVCTTNAILWLAPTGGLTPTFGNNPLGVGIPAGARHPIVLDFSMSVEA